MQQSKEKTLGFLMVLSLIGMGILSAVMLAEGLFYKIPDREYLYELAKGAILLGILSMIFLLLYVLEIKSKNKENKSIEGQAHQQ